MATHKISVDFSRFSDADLIQKSQWIITSMTGNTNYPTPVPTLASVSAAILAYGNALTKTENGNTNDTLAKNQKRKVLEDLLKNLGYYVQPNGKNDPLILGSSGFDLQKEKATVGVLPKPENLKLLASKGSMKITMNVIKGALSYNFLYTTMPVTESSVWITQSGTSKSALIEGLTSGEMYAFKSCGVGTNPIRVYSDIVTSYIL